jgi:predicted AAA+ superfamily ATPase
MYPMSFREFLMALGEEQGLAYLDEAIQTKVLPDLVHTHLWERLKWYLITGGLPEVVATFCRHQDNLFNAFKAAREVQNQLIIAYNADMAKHAGKINAMHLTRLWRAIPEQLARSQDASAKKFVFKDAIPGVNRYDRLVGVIDWLEAAGMIIKVHITESGQVPFSAHAKENAFKLFLADVGLLGAISGLDPETILAYDYGSYKGYYAENFVAQEFMCQGRGPLYSWQEKTAEVEFLFQKAGQVIPVEVKSGWVTHAKSIHLFASKYHSPFRVILSAHNLNVAPQSPIHRYPLYLAEQVLD